MKFGMRTPNPKSMLKARTTGRLKRAAKRAVDPTYGKKGSGRIKDPGRAAYNATYRRTTASATGGDNSGCSGCLTIVIGGIVVWLAWSFVRGIF